MRIKDIDNLINTCKYCRMDKTFIPTTPEECRAYADGYAHCRDDIIEILLQLREENAEKTDESEE